MAQNEEESIAEVEPMEVTVNRPITYQIEDHGTNQGKRKLSDSRGFTYTVKRQRKNNTITDWCCSVRLKAHRCPATVVQNGDNFRNGPSAHNHQAKSGIGTAVKIMAEIKARAKNEVFTSASTIVQDVLQARVNESEPDNSRPDVEKLIRWANRAREKMRPKHPVNLEDFRVDHAFISDNFYLEVAKVDDRRHFAFATPDGLDALAKAQRWYMDGTFKIVRAPSTSC